MMFDPRRKRAWLLAGAALCAAAVCSVLLLTRARPASVEEGGPVFMDEAEADARLQRAAESALGGRAGAVLVVDAQTGRVRAQAGGRLAFEEATPPGSAVKPFTALAALGAGALTEETRHACRGRYEREGLSLNCTHPRHRAPFGPRAALAESCNDFYGRAAEALDPALFVGKLEEFGFGALTGGGGEAETAGLLPPPRGRALPAEMLGESERLRVTPAQLVTAYAALFNGGRLLVPQRARGEGFAPRARARLEVEPGHRALLYAGMRGAVAHGTASRAGLSTLALRVFGKTGTSTPPEGFRPQGWFVALAADAGAGGDDEPRPESVGLAVVVFLKRGTGSEAAAAARPVLEEYARARRGERVDEAGRDSQVQDAGPSVRVRLARADRTLALALEDYVAGVLAAEGSVEDEPEALKALAVVARTYALHNLGRHARDGFDLCDTTHCQRYVHHSQAASRPDFYELLGGAVRATAGEVLTDPAGRAAEAYFSASCGGTTADARTLWGARDAPPHLRGGRDEACAADPHPWADAIETADLLRALRADARGDVGARLDSVRVLRRDAGGRAELVELEGERRRVLRGWDFKIIVGRTLGWSVLKSSRFEVARAGTRFLFRGRGFGHGLGLCQAGAHHLAARGAGYTQILARYLPGTGLKKRDEERADPRPRFAPAAFTPAPPPEPEASSPQSAVLSSEHFSLRYPARVARREAEAVLRELEAARAALARRLGRASFGGAAPDAVEVFAHETTGDFVGATGQPAWVAAVTEGRRVTLQPLEVLRRRGVLSTTLRHELVHVACETLGRGRAPRWLVEGLAVHVAGEGPAYARAAERLDLPVEELERRLARPASAAEMRALYAAAYRETSALIRRDGEPAVWRRVAGR